jgi:hypothetical protein
VTANETETWSPERLRSIFRHYADVDLPAADAWLYAALAAGVAADPEVMAVAATVRRGQPPPNLLFAAVHALLLAGTRHPLAAHYPDLTPEPEPVGAAYPHFRDFCVAHRAAITSLVQSRLVQTNVLERCGLLLPAISTAAAALGAPSGPLAVIEVGTSAGLNLLWDRYTYDFGGTAWGDEASPVRLAIDVRGHVPLPVIPAGLRSVWSRGVDLEPVDLRNPEALLWQRALMWPERLDRQHRIEAAQQLMARGAPTIISGDACQAMPTLLRDAPLQLPLVVLASFTLYQFPAASRARLMEILATEGERRPVALVTVEIKRVGDAFGTVDVAIHDGGGIEQRTLARGHPHGAWMEWMPDA